MRTLVLVGLVELVGGCSFQAVPGNLAADAADADGTAADAEVDGSSEVDSDGDGVFDATDNCRAEPNADQHDEDGDLAGDKCDPCPQVANEAATNSDADALLDACDPRPLTAGDVLVRFETFAGNALPAGWDLVTGLDANLTFAGDVLTIDAADDTHMLLFDTGSPRHAIDVGVDLPDETDGTTFFSALTDAKADVSQYFACGIRLDLAAREFIQFQGSFAPVALDPLPAETPAFPDRFRFVSALSSVQQTCAIPSAATRHEMSAAASTKGRHNVGLRAGNLTLAIRYVAIYTF